MYVTNLSIDNFRNFTSFSIDLQPFTLIIGANNTGKSNMLEAISLLLSQDITIFKRRILGIDDINYETIKTFKKQVIDSRTPLDKVVFPEVRVSLIFTDFDESQEAVVGDWFIDKDLKKAKLTYVFRLRDGWQNKEKWLQSQRERNLSEEEIDLIDFPIEEYEYSIFGGNGEENRADHYFLQMIKMELLDALRDAKRELSASGEYRLLYRVLNNRDKNKYSSIQKAIIDLENVVKTDSEFTKVKGEIQSYLEKLSLQENNLDNGVSFKFVSPELSEILRKLSLEYGANPIGVERNGLGRNNLLYISLILSHLAGDSNNGRKIFFRLVGIEEPEAHLHPHLQHHLANNIKGEVNKILQVIITSHSPYLSSQLDLDSTYVLYKRSGNIEKHRLLSGFDENDSSIKYLKKFVDSTNSVMFFAERVILVEGIAEELLIPKLFEIHSGGKSLEKCGCNVVNVRGLAFEHFLKIVKNGYFIKCVTFTDNDNNSRGTDLKTEYEKDNNVIKVSVSTGKTFEVDLIDANKAGESKKILFRALSKTKPNNGPQLEEKTNGQDINIADFFSEIEHYKSEFAFNLLEELESQTNKLVIPKYIEDGFNHIMDQ